jgi:hypothetical protein
MVLGCSLITYEHQGHQPFFLSCGRCFGHHCSSPSDGLTPADPYSAASDIAFRSGSPAAPSPTSISACWVIPNILAQSYLHLPYASVRSACIAAASMKWRRWESEPRRRACRSSYVWHCWMENHKNDSDHMPVDPSSALLDMPTKEFT